MCIHTFTTFHKACLHLVDTPRQGPGYIPPKYCDQVKYLLDLYHSQPLRPPEPEPLKIPSACKIDYGDGTSFHPGNVATRFNPLPCQFCQCAGQWLQLEQEHRANNKKMATQHGEWRGDPSAIPPPPPKLEYCGYAIMGGGSGPPTTVRDVGSLYRNQDGKEALDPQVQAELARAREELRKKYGQPDVPRNVGGEGGPVIVEDCTDLLDGEAATSSNTPATSPIPTPYEPVSAVTVMHIPHEVSNSRRPKQHNHPSDDARNYPGEYSTHSYYQPLEVRAPRGSKRGNNRSWGKRGRGNGRRGEKSG